ncbi:MAG: prepilin-type N-terminal cleavage/methylation domain-containing protein [Verrucomicrobiota bacterium]
MKPSAHLTQKLKTLSMQRGFTLMETVIAILVLAVLLTGFLTVFTPAAQGIRRSISTQQADRLKATLERDMSTLRVGESTPGLATGFDKAFTWIKEGNTATKAIFVYQYRGNRGLPARADGTMQPMTNIEGKPGVDYITQTAARRADDTLFLEDLDAIVGPLFYVIPTQLIEENNELILGTPGIIANPGGGPAGSPSEYTDAVITFSAAFHLTPSVSPGYIQGGKFSTKFTAAAQPNSNIKPVFIRNLAVRR